MNPLTPARTALVPRVQMPPDVADLHAAGNRPHRVGEQRRRPDGLGGLDDHRRRRHPGAAQEPPQLLGEAVDRLTLYPEDQAVAPLVDVEEHRPVRGKLGPHLVFPGLEIAEIVVAAFEHQAVGQALHLAGAGDVLEIDMGGAALVEIEPAEAGHLRRHLRIFIVQAPRHSSCARTAGTALNSAATQKIRVQKRKVIMMFELPVRPAARLPPDSTTLGSEGDPRPVRSLRAVLKSFWNPPCGPWCPSSALP